MLFTNLRVMIEADDIIDEYYGPNGFRYDKPWTVQPFLFHLHAQVAKCNYLHFVFVSGVDCSAEPVDCSDD